MRPGRHNLVQFTQKFPSFPPELLSPATPILLAVLPYRLSQIQELLQSKPSRASTGPAGEPGAAEACSRTGTGEAPTDKPIRASPELQSGDAAAAEEMTGLLFRVFSCS
ncbi:hypothetical protein SRHO_G00154670 [Serrasalmus rhombeus]